MGVLSISEARAHLSELLDRVARGEEITRHGRPAAVVLRPDLVPERRAESTLTRANELAASLAEARRRPLAPAVVTAEHADEWVASIDRARGRG